MLVCALLISVPLSAARSHGEFERVVCLSTFAFYGTMEASTESGMNKNALSLYTASDPSFKGGGFALRNCMAVTLGTASFAL